MERLIQKANKDNDLLRTRVKLHARKERIALAKLKRANAKIESLTKQGEEERLDILSEVSLHQAIDNQVPSQILVNFGTFFTFGRFYVFQYIYTHKFCQRRSDPDTALLFGASK